MNAIVVCDNKWGIGKNNDLLFSLPLDMKHFKELTLGKVVVMGKNTLLSFPGEKPLKNRINIVVSSSLNREDCIVVHNIIELKKILKNYNPDDIFLIGGGSMYEQLLPMCKKAYITKADADGNADVFFRNLDADKNWRCISVSDTYNTNNIDIVFCEYENLSPII